MVVVVLKAVAGMFLVEEEADEMNADDEGGSRASGLPHLIMQLLRGQALARTCPFVARPCARDGLAGCLRTVRLIPKTDVYFLEGVNGLQRQACRCL